MRLSEAIRLGAMLKPQKFGPPSHQLKYETETCALAGVAEVIGEQNLNVCGWNKRWPVLKQQRFCPACVMNGNKPDVVTGVITHLNDRHRWTREQIADWVETIESAAVPPSMDATTDEVFAVDPVLVRGTDGLRAKEDP